MKKLNKKIISPIDPSFRKKIWEMFELMDQSISLLYEAATHDEKTGIYNIKFFNDVIEMEIEKAKRGQEKLSLIILDIDFFKKINDKYGHLKADDILKKFANAIRDETRKSDIFARFGGEEFVLLLPETSLIKAKQFVKRLIKKVHNDKFLKKYKITFSAGITEFKKGDSKRKLMEGADKALYKAKKSGRDKFCFACR
ncbi:MAG: GGDEF domain-containing protein [Nanoarchaeota archaeon]